MDFPGFSTTVAEMEAGARAFCAALRDLPSTILRGWPDGWGDPTEMEAEQIEAAHHELLMHEPDMGEDRAWMIAGNIVARFRRDITAT